MILTEKYRFDDELDEFSEKINKGIPISMNQVITTPLRVNLAYTHNTRIVVNDLCMEHFDKSKPQYLEIPYIKKNFETGNIAQTVYLSHGTPIIANNTIEGGFGMRRKAEQPESVNTIFNRDRFSVKCWDTENITMINDDNKDVLVPINEFHKNFRVAYCTTIHSTQCMTLKCDIGLYNVKKYSRRMMYTAVTRADNLSRLFVSEPITDYVFKEDDLSFKTIPIYENDDAGVVYCLHTDQPEVIYHIGVTKCIDQELAKINREVEYNINTTLAKGIRDNKYVIKCKILHQVPSVEIIRRKIDVIRNNYMNKGYSLLVYSQELRNIKLLTAGIDIKPITQCVGAVNQHMKNGKVCGYIYRHKKTSKVFSIAKFGDLEKAKKAAEEYRLIVSN